MVEEKAWVVPFITLACPVLPTVYFLSVCLHSPMGPVFLYPAFSLSLGTHVPDSSPRQLSCEVPLPTPAHQYYLCSACW